MTEAGARPFPAVALEAPHLLRALFELSPFSTVLYDAEGRVLAVNPAFERMWGVSIETVPPSYSVMHDPELGRQGVLPLIRRAFAGEAVVTPPLRYDIAAVSRTGTGRTLWTEGHLWPVRDAEGRITHVVLQHVDLTAPIEAQQTLEREHARVQLFARTGALLATMLEPRAAMQQIADIVVPGFADWCSIDLLTADGRIEPAAAAHRDPSKLELTRQLHRRFQTDVTAATGVPAAIRNRQPEHYAEVTEEVLRAMARDEEHLRLLQEVGFHSGIVVPLLARDRTLGALTLVTTAESGRRFSATDVLTASELAWRAALAVDNARLYLEQIAAADRMTRLQRATAALASAVTAEETAEAIVDEGVAALQADNGVLCLLSGDGQTLEIVKQVGLPEATAREFSRFPLNAPLPASDAVRTGDAVYLEDKRAVVNRYPTLSARNAQARSEAWAALPLRVGSDTVGAVAFGFNTQRQFTAPERLFLDALTAQCGQALQRVRLIEAERAARAEAENANRAKMEFLATMSHELRTPLNAIGGYAELLELEVRGPLTAAQREDIERLRRSQQSLVRLVEDVLNFAKIEAGSLHLRNEPIAIADVLGGLEEVMTPQVRSRGLDYRFVRPAAEVVVRADRERLEQIVLNLLSNAIKFTEQGHVELSVECSDHRALIHVSDTGIGIEPDKIELIFEPFVQIQSGYTRRASGTGLGLAISRDLARRMHGDLTATSTPGVGSTFTLSLPLEG